MFVTLTPGNALPARHKSHDSQLQYRMPSTNIPWFGHQHQSFTPTLHHVVDENKM